MSSHACINCFYLSNFWYVIGSRLERVIVILESKHMYSILCYGLLTWVHNFEILGFSCYAVCCVLAPVIMNFVVFFPFVILMLNRCGRNVLLVQQHLNV